MPKHLISLIFGLLVCASNLQADETVRVVLLAGQSNMAGAGNYNDLSDSDQQRIKSVSSRVLLSVGGKPAMPLSYTHSKGALAKRGYAETFGPEMFIGVTLAEAFPRQQFLLVKVAQGGTSLYGAWNPQWSAEQSKAVEKGERKQKMKLYQQHVAAIKKNLSSLDQQNKSHQIIAAAWMQGENDAAREVSARSYKVNLTKLIDAYRTEFNLKEMPFVCGQINSAYGEFAEGPDIVRAAFVDVAEADPKVMVIRTMKERPPTDFPKVDGAHYNAEGQKRLGTAMGRNIIELQTTKPSK